MLIYGRVRFLIFICALSVNLGTLAQPTNASIWGPGSKIKLSSGNIVTLKEKINNNTGTTEYGGTTDIYSVEEDPLVAIRIQKDDSSLKSNYIEETIVGDKELKRNEVPSVRILDFSPEYSWIAVERIDFSHYLQDFLDDPFRWDQAERQKMVRSLINFVRKSANFVVIGDLTPQQIVWEKNRGWILLDWRSHHVQIQNIPVRPVLAFKQSTIIPNLMSRRQYFRFDRFKINSFNKRLEQLLLKAISESRMVRHCQKYLQKSVSKLQLHTQEQ